MLVLALCLVGLVTKHACDRQTDRQTDRQNYDSQDRASIAASRGKKYCAKQIAVLGLRQAGG